MSRIGSRGPTAPTPVGPLAGGSGSGAGTCEFCDRSAICDALDAPAGMQSRRSKAAGLDVLSDILGSTRSRVGQPGLGFLQKHDMNSRKGTTSSLRVPCRRPCNESNEEYEACRAFLHPQNEHL